MREIEFRGKMIGADVWRYGYIRCICGDDYAINSPVERYCWSIAIGTAGQYTGLLDKNGRKIFEGDILRVQTSRTDPAVYDNRVVEYKAPYFTGFIFDKGEYEPQYHEIIGNIHDNPKLVEK